MPRRRTACATPVPGAPARRRRARLVELGDGRGLVLLPAAYDAASGTVHLGVLSVLLTGPGVVTISRGAAPDLGPVRAALAAGSGHTAGLVEALLAGVVEGYDSVLDELDADVSEVEAEVFSAGRSSRAERIYRLKREVLELQRAVGPLPDVVARLDCTARLRDRVLRVGEHLGRLDALLDSVLSADLAQVGVRQNEDQRRISAWAAIALVPTVVAGIYGMNFQHMPELSLRYGYPGALALIAGVCSTLYRGFRRNGWLGPAR